MTSLTALDATLVASPAASPSSPVQQGDEPFYPIFIPSKGRSHNRKGTVAQLMLSGVPFTLVVEPQEQTVYQNLIASLAADNNVSSTLASVVSLPLSDQGVTYVRNHILHQLAPVDGWFWIMDDDIQGFHRATNRVNVSISAAEMLREAMRRMKLHSGAALYSIDYPFYAWQYNDAAVAVNSYNNIAVVMNRTLLPPGIQYRFRIREDYDFTLQIILFGQTTVRFRNLSFRVPRMAAAAGGMTDYYEKQKADIAEQNKMFLEMWPSVSREVTKGTGDMIRLDMNIKWMALNPSKCADPSAILKSKVVLNKNPLERKVKIPRAPKDQKKVRSPKALSRASTVSRKRRRSGSSSSDSSAVTTDDSDDEDDEDEDESDESYSSLSEDEAPVGRARKPTAPREPRQRPPKPPQPPREKVLPGWKGFTMEKYRDPLPEVIKSAGLVRIADEDVKLGHVILIIPYDLELPAIVHACIVEVTRYPAPKSWNWSAVIEKMRGAPVQTVSSCYRLERDGADITLAAAVIDAAAVADDEVPQEPFKGD
jgi:hypothetical protein